MADMPGTSGNLFLPAAADMPSRTAPVSIWGHGGRQQRFGRTVAGGGDLGERLEQQLSRLEHAKDGAQILVCAWVTFAWALIFQP